jgi:hypothetical protein
VKYFRHHRVIGRVCQWVVPALVAPLLFYYSPQVKAVDAPLAGGASSPTDTARIPAVIVLDFTNLSGYNGDLVGRSAAAAVSQAMTDSDRWEVLSSTVVNTAINNLGLTPPLDLSAIRQLGREADADSIVVGQVYAVQITDNPRQARVGVRVEMRDVTSGELVNGAVETAQSGARPGYSGDPQVLVDEAIRKAAFQAVTTMNQNRLPQGTILNTQVTGTGQREVLINIGAQNGVQEGMEFIVTRNNTQVSRLRIVRVEPDQSTAIVVSGTQGAQPEDRVTAVFTLASADELRASIKGDVLPGAPKPKRKGKGLSSALGAILGAAILIFALSGSTKSGRLTGPNGGFPAAEATSLNQAAVPGDGAAVKVSWTVPNLSRPEDILEFQIYRSDIVTIPMGATQVPPVGIVPPGQNFFYDTTLPRDVTFAQVPPGSTPSTPGGTTTTTGTGTTTSGGTQVPYLTVAGVQGVTPGRSVTYRVVMVYRRVETVSGTTTTTGTTTTGTDTSTSTGTTTGTSTQRILILQTPVVTTAPVTPIEPPEAASPQGGTEVDPTNVTFDIQASQGANEYMIELSTDPTFRNPQQIKLPLQPASQTGSAISAQNVNLTRLFPNFHGTLYWHVGARNFYDQPGPDPGRFAGLPGDRRWVYSGFETITIP